MTEEEAPDEVLKDVAADDATGHGLKGLIKEAAREGVSSRSTDLGPPL